MRRSLVGLFALLCASILGGCSGPSQEESSASTQPALVAFFVRHGEKVAASTDPALSPAGEVRAQTLAHLLGSAAIGTIHSSDYTRTRETAAPLAARLDLDVELYDPRDLPALAARLRASGGRHLIVGHSNTTPVIVELLGGDPVSEIDEATEYDRLYVVTVGADGTVSSALLRFGVPYVAPTS